MTFYLCEHDILSAFSENEKEEYEKLVHKIVGTMQVETRNINSIIKENCSMFDNGLDFMNVGVEGVGFDYLRPKVICVETITHRNHLEQSKNEKLTNLLLSKKYFIYADTYINTIFVDIN